MTALRELAERWKALADRDTMADDLLIGMSLSRDTCADELLSILDAEGDGGAVDWQHREVVDGKPMEWQQCLRGTYLYWSTPENRSRGVAEVRELFHHPQPVRSGVVSDLVSALKEISEIRWSYAATNGCAHTAAMTAKAALEHFAKSQGESNV